MTTRARHASNAISEWSRFSRFDQDELSIQGQELVTNELSLGDPTVPQLTRGQYSTSVQAAIEQLANAKIPVGGVLTTTSVTSPSGVPFVEDIEITGVATGEYVTIYGIGVPVLVGDEGPDIAAKIVTHLNTVTAGLFSQTVPVDISPVNAYTVRVTHRDNMRHTSYSWNGNGITLTGSIVDQSDADNTVCYGTWDLIHTETLGTTPVYHWLRTL